MKPLARLQPLRIAFSLALLLPEVATIALARLPGDPASLGPRNESVDLAPYADVRYVVAGTEQGDGSKSKPWSSVSEAVAHVNATAEHRVAILVAAGTYNDATVHMREHVDLYGGFEPGSWNRDIFAHPSILDGRDAWRVVIGASNARIDGFTICHGRALGHGGGILCDGTSPTIANNLIEKNHTLAPTDFHYERIHQQGNIGGGIACLYEAVPVIARNVIRANWTEIGEGGGLAFYGWHRLPGNPRARVENNVIVDNTSGTKDYARTRSSSGGGVSFAHEASQVFVNNIVAHNHAMGRSDAGGIYNEFYSSPRIENNWIVGNEGDDDGGGIYTMRQGEPFIHHNLIAGNWTTLGGVGGVRVSKEGRARVEDNHIVRNQSGGGLYLVDGYLEARDNVIADNLKGYGIRIQQHFQYFQPARIEGNRILRNEEGSVDVQKNVGEAPLVDRNSVVDGAPETAATSCAVTAASYNSSRAQTVVRIAPGSKIKPAAGQVVWRGKHWAVVAASDDSSVTVWGDMSAADLEATLHLLPDYDAK